MDWAVCALRRMEEVTGTVGIGDTVYTVPLLSITAHIQAERFGGAQHSIRAPLLFRNVQQNGTNLHSRQGGAVGPAVGASAPRLGIGPTEILSPLKPQTLVLSEGHQHSCPLPLASCTVRKGTFRTR